MVRTPSEHGTHRPPGRRERWGPPLGWAAWFVVTFLVGLQTNAGESPVRSGGHQSAWATALVFAAFNTATLFAIVRLTLRFPVGWRHAGRNLGIHAAAALLLAGLSLLVDHLDERWLGVPSAGGWLSRLALELVNYALLAGVVHAVEHARRYRRSEAAGRGLRAALGEAGRRRADAELRALRAELDPHYLGNALNAAAALVHADPRAAERVLAQLGEMMRRSVARAGVGPVAHEVTLEQELTALEPFLTLESERLGGRLAVERDVPTDLLDASMPELLLQPAVENAVRHGLAPRGGGQLRITARRVGADGGQLELVVANDGVPLDADGGARRARDRHRRGGVGLANARRRLAELYGGDVGTVRLEPGVGGVGAATRITLPWRPVGSADDALTPRSLAAVSAAAGDDPRQPAEWDRHRRPGGSTLAARLTGAAPGAWPTLWFGVAWALCTVMARNIVLPDGSHAPLGKAVVEGFVTALAWAGILLTALRYTRTHPIAPEAGWRNLGVHATAALAVATLVAAMKLALPLLLGYPLPAALGARVAQIVAGNLGLYALLAGAAHAVEYARRDRRTEAAGRGLSAALGEAGRRRADAELRALRAELNPRYLGDALHDAARLVATDPAAAERVIAQLGELVHTALVGAATHEVTLEEEIAALESFLAIERARSEAPDGLVVEWDVPEDALDARVPDLILQSLVESVVQRVPAPRGGRRLGVTARHRAGATHGDVLELLVVGDAERPNRAADGSLTNARRRLAERYGSEASLTVGPNPDGAGSIARLALPWIDDAPHGDWRGRGGVHGHPASPPS